MIKLKLPEFNISKDDVCKFCFCLSFVLFASSLAMQIFVTNKYSIKGGEMVSLKAQEATLALEVSALKLSISETSSLANVEKRAANLGLAEYSSTIAAINSSQFVAAR